MEAFFGEAMVMKDFEHENVLSLIGVSIKGSQPLVVLPYMEHGDLKTYIREPTRVCSCPFLVSQLVDSVNFRSQ